MQNKCDYNNLYICNIDNFNSIVRMNCNVTNKNELEELIHSNRTSSNEDDNSEIVSNL